MTRIEAIIQFARSAFRNDGAEGETVHALCDQVERLTQQLDDTSFADRCKSTALKVLRHGSDELLDACNGVVAAAEVEVARLTTERDEARAALADKAMVLERYAALLQQNVALVKGRDEFRKLICEANPLAWVASRDERSASDWEVRVHSIKVENACRLAGSSGEKEGAT